MLGEVSGDLSGEVSGELSDEVSGAADFAHQTKCNNSYNFLFKVKNTISHKFALGESFGIEGSNNFLAERVV